MSWYGIKVGWRQCISLHMLMSVCAHVCLTLGGCDETFAGRGVCSCRQPHLLQAQHCDVARRCQEDLRCPASQGPRVPEPVRLETLWGNRTPPPRAHMKTSQTYSKNISASRSSLSANWAKMIIPFLSSIDKRNDNIWCKKKKRKYTYWVGAKQCRYCSFSISAPTPMYLNTGFVLLGMSFMSRY